MINIVLYEDNADFVESISYLFQQTDDIRLLAHYTNTTQISKVIKFHKPNIVLMDIDLQGESGIQALRTLRTTNTDVCVVMLTVFDDDDRIFQSICEGANGYVLKSTQPAKILEYIREANDGGAPMSPSVATQVLKIFSAPYKKASNYEGLSEKEHAVLSCLVRGCSYKLAATELHVSIETIRFHIKNIYKKLNVNSKSEAVLKAVQNNIVK